MKAAEALPLLRLRGASVAFGPVQALRDVSLSVCAGDVMVVIGANGSGKSTLLRVLHGIQACAGERSVARGAGAHAMLFQRPFLLRLSVGKNLRIAVWLACRALSPAQRRARTSEALERVGLTALRDRAAHSLSGGEQQRLALARAWATGPAILFLDEPTANLDPSATNEVEALLAGFAADGVTLVMSTHNLGQARRLATRVVYMERGRVECDLPCRQFFDAEPHGSAASFLKGELSWSPDA